MLTTAPAMTTNAASETTSRHLFQVPSNMMRGAPKIMATITMSFNNDVESAQEDNDDEDEVQDLQQKEQPEVEEQATGLSMPKENNFLSSFPNTTGLSDEFVAAHRNSLNNRSDDSSTRETITEGADEIGKLAAAAVNDYDLGGLTGFKL